jgi:hypothetical protein
MATTEKLEVLKWRLEVTAGKAEAWSSHPDEMSIGWVAAIAELGRNVRSIAKSVKHLIETQA